MVTIKLFYLYGIKIPLFFILTLISSNYFLILYIFFSNFDSYCFLNFYG